MCSSWQGCRPLSKASKRFSEIWKNMKGVSRRDLLALILMEASREIPPITGPRSPSVLFLWLHAQLLQLSSFIQLGSSEPIKIFVVTSSSIVGMRCSWNHWKLFYWRLTNFLGGHNRVCLRLMHHILQSWPRIPVCAATADLILYLSYFRCL